MNRAHLAAALLSLALAGGPALAQNLETAVMPGKVIAGHAKFEADCGKCHVRFDRSAQPGLCLDCHKELARDVRAGSGFHGRLRERDCRRCHTDHRGREARIVQLDERTFDHATTDYPLQGRHVTVRCAACHPAGRKHREAPADCTACHRKDDVHRAQLGDACANCHDVARWKDARFDHARSRFPLLQRHAQVKCGACHADPRYAGTPRECAACHRKDDAHRGAFGERCAKCHDAGDWKGSAFRHDRDTAFPLRDRHRAVKCEACHRLPAAQAKTPSACQACHRKDDVHKGMLGERCAACHDETRWKQSRFDHDRDSPFALRGAHRSVKCAECHRDVHFRDKAPRACVGCHRNIDQQRGHKGRYGEACESCHTEERWKALRFRHDHDTRYALRGAHARAPCDACHRGALYRDRTPAECIGCHQRDDRHRGQLGEQCDRCHGEQGWRDTTFSHAQSRFPLLGRHARIACKDCHATPAYLDARTDCASCHAKRDDVHFGSLGAKCDRCHVAADWRTIVGPERQALPAAKRPARAAR